jgi:hypothetical protein
VGADSTVFFKVLFVCSLCLKKQFQGVMFTEGRDTSFSQFNCSLAGRGECGWAKELLTAFMLFCMPKELIFDKKTEKN